MWGVPTAREVTQSPKLRTLFATNTPIEPGRLYGSIEAGTARILFTPGREYVTGQFNNNEFYGPPREYGLRASYRF